MSFSVHFWSMKPGDYCLVNRNTRRFRLPQKSVSHILTVELLHITVIMWWYRGTHLCDGTAAHIYACMDNRTSNWDNIQCGDGRHDKSGTQSPSMVERWKGLTVRLASDGTAGAQRSLYALYRVLEREPSYNWAIKYTSTNPRCLFQA